MKPLEFLKKVCHVDETDNINYKPYEHSSVIKAIPVREAVEMIKKDIKEMEDFFIPYGLESKAQDAVYKVWKKKLVVF